MKKVLKFISKKFNLLKGEKALVINGKKLPKDDLLSVHAKNGNKIMILCNNI